ncbi:hypothetical protein GF402_05725 [Candidatus Fermentibacteria bacterium]|nr:hypothetical protein [Candidatus Fermentibacteria bacterium]
MAILLTASAATADVSQQRSGNIWRMMAGFDPFEVSSELVSRRLLLNRCDREGLSVLPTSWGSSSTDLRQRILNGSRYAMVPLVLRFVDRGRIEEAEFTFALGGRDVPATRRDLAIALSWYGRFSVYPMLGDRAEMPPDLEEDDYARNISAVLRLGWMRPGPDGLFYGGELARKGDLQLVRERFLGPGSTAWHRSWISVSELDLYLRSGSGEEPPR